MRLSCKDKVEETKSIDIRELSRKKLLIPGTSINSTWSSGGHITSSTKMIVEDHSLRFLYKYNSKSMNYIVNLDYTKTNYGYRKWFICPHCYKRIAKLYLTDGYFVCRNCADINYESTGYGGELSVVQHKIDRITAKLKMNSCFDTPERPKWMHYRTYLKLRLELIKLNDNALSILSSSINVISDSTERFKSKG